MSKIPSGDVFAYDTKTKMFHTVWDMSNEEHLSLHNYTQDAAEMGVQMERNRILALFDLEADNMPVNHIIHMILKDVTK